MTRAHKIALSALSLVVVVALFLFVGKGRHSETVGQSESGEASESSLNGVDSSDPGATIGPVPVLERGKSGAVKTPGKGAAAIASIPGTGSSAVGGMAALVPGAPVLPGGATAPATEVKKATAPCQVAELKTDVQDLKGHLNEFRLARALESKEPLCVLVDGKSVGHTRLKDGRVRIDWKIVRASAKVAAKFCSDGVKCEVSCPEPEKDFWDTLGGNDELAAGTGFAEADTGEDKALQKEIKELKDVLKRKPAEALVANWTVSGQKDSSCN